MRSTTKLLTFVHIAGKIGFPTVFVRNVGITTEHLC